MLNANFQLVQLLFKKIAQDLHTILSRTQDALKSNNISPKNLWMPKKMETIVIIDFLDQQIIKLNKIL